jgi:hypothetical protein
MADHDQDGWQRFLSEYAVARGEYQAAKAVVDRSARNFDTLRGACLAEDRAREKLVALRRRMSGLHPLEDGAPSDHGTTATQGALAA